MSSLSLSLSPWKVNCWRTANHAFQVRQRRLKFICPSVRLSVCPSVRLSVCPSVRLSVCPSVRLSVCLCANWSHLGCVSAWKQPSPSCAHPCSWTFKKASPRREAKDAENVLPKKVCALVHCRASESKKEPHELSLLYVTFNSSPLEWC